MWSVILTCSQLSNNTVQSGKSGLSVRWLSCHQGSSRRATHEIFSRCYLPPNASTVEASIALNTELFQNVDSRVNQSIMYLLGVAANAASKHQSCTELELCPPPPPREKRGLSSGARQISHLRRLSRQEGGTIQDHVHKYC